MRLYYFSSNITYFWQKYPIKVQIFRFSTARVKIHQISHVIFQTKNEFLLKVWITLQCHQRYLFCTILAETVHDLDKDPIKVQDFRLLTAHIKFHQICVLIDFFCWKYIKTFAEKVQRSYVSLPWGLMQNLMKNWSFVSKMTRIWWILTWILESLKDLHFYWFLLCKVFNVWPKKVQRSYLSWHWRVMQNLKKNWLVVWKMTWRICHKFSPEHLKVLKLRLKWDPFVQNRKCMSLKFTEELYVMAMKNDAKFEEELICCSKIDMGNSINFDLSTWKSQKFSLWCALFEQSMYYLS